MPPYSAVNTAPFFGKLAITMAFEFPQQVTLSEAVYEELRKRIVKREYKPGTHLVERTLADEFGVSRVPVREAMKKLVTDGLVEDRPRSGMFVTEVGSDDLDELLEIAFALDRVLFSRMAVKMTDDDAATVQELLDRTQAAIEADDPAKAVLLNASFHTLAQSIAGSRVLSRIITQVDLHLEWLLVQHENPAELLAEHTAIFEAMKKKDDDALTEAVASHAMVSRRTACAMNR